MEAEIRLSIIRNDVTLTNKINVIMELTEVWS